MSFNQLRFNQEFSDAYPAAIMDINGIDTIMLNVHKSTKQTMSSLSISVDTQRWQEMILPVLFSTH